MSIHTTVQTIVVDDHPLFRRGVVELLTESGHFEVVNDFGSAVELLENMPEVHPDLLLMDFQMPGLTGIEAVKKLRPQLPNTKIVMLAVSMDAQSLLEVISAGVDGYLPKDTDAEVILNKLTKVLNGQMILSDSSLNLLAEGLRAQSFGTFSTPDVTQNHESLKDLTERERQTLDLISKGLNNKLIARELGISDGTVKVYVKNLLRKLGLHSRLELAAWKHNQKIDIFGDG
ncbi:MAG: response regulator transcription factor [Thiotrichales bacterium]|nr:response regulator transcription factor [Thiotrichales bacterium]